MSNLRTNLIRKKVGEKIVTQPQPTKIIEDVKRVIRQKNYTTNGEILIVVKDVDKCNLVLNSDNTDHIIIKALTNVSIKPSKNLIDEYYQEIEINRGACVEFFLLENNWYIVSSDGLKIG